MDRDELVPEWQLSDEELIAALLAAETVLRRERARMLELVGEADRRRVAEGFP